MNIFNLSSRLQANHVATPNTTMRHNGMKRRFERSFSKFLPLLSLIALPSFISVRVVSAQTPATVYSYNIPSFDGYAPNGNLIAYTDSVMGSWKFGYNGLGTVTNATVTPAINQFSAYCWSYDPFGNRTGQFGSNQALTTASGVPCQPAAGASFSTDIAAYNTLNQVTSTNANGTTFAPVYDASGNITQDGKNSYLYDGEGRVCAIGTTAFSGGIIMTQYLYDEAGQRVAKGIISTWNCDASSNGFRPSSLYLLGPSGEQVTELDGSGNWKHTNVYAAGSLIGTYDNQGLHFHLNDWLGTRRAQTNYAGTLEATYQNLPFGDGLPPPSSNDPTEHHFTGKERDTESGLDDFGARYYSSNMGIMISADPHTGTMLHILNPQRWNMYSYALNNPLTFTDPTGMDAIAINFSGMVGGLGHEGILSINSDGSAKYARFGPGSGVGLDSPGKTIATSLSIKVEFGSNGLPTSASYKEIENEVAGLEKVSPKTVRLNYFKTSDVDTAALNTWIDQQKNVPGRYKFCTRNCANFTVQSLLAGGAINQAQASNLSNHPNTLYKELVPLAVISSPIYSVKSRIVSYGEKTNFPNSPN